MLSTNRETLGKYLLVFSLLAFFAITGLGPLVTLVARSLENGSQHFVGFDNYLRYFTDPSLFRTLRNTVVVSALTMVITVSAAFFFAYGLQRTTIPGKGFFRILALSPLFAPTLMHGIALVYLFGNKGLVTTGCFGLLPGLHVDIYGPIGIIMAECICNFPSAFLLITVALSMADRRLRESADSMGASRWLRFVSITLPSVKYGLASACFATFTASFVDFGAPKVIGGNFNVLSVEIYKQVVGLQNFNLGAAISLILALPTIIAFVMDYKMQKSAQMTFSSKSLPLKPSGGFKRNLFFFAGNSLIAGSILIVNAVVVLASFVKTWPYKLELVLDHYDFRDVAGGGFEAFLTSVKLSAITALAGCILAFLLAWIVQRSRLGAWFTGPIRLFALIPLSLPGMVIGLSYIFFFNSPTLGESVLTFPNPLGWVYNTFLILVLANLFHFISVPFLTCSSGISKLDPEIENASTSMGIPFWMTIRCITFPLCLESIMEVALYFFVNSMITVSAVIFLFSPHIHLAAVAVVDMEDAGDIACAAAMSVLILLTNVLARLLYLGLRHIQHLMQQRRSYAT